MDFDPEQLSSRGRAGGDSPGPDVPRRRAPVWGRTIGDRGTFGPSTAPRDGRTVRVSPGLGRWREVDMIDPAVAMEFLSRSRIAVVGASDDPKNFGRTVYKELRKHGFDAVAVNPNASTVDGDRCYGNLAAVPGDVDGVIVMVQRDRAVDAVRECASRGVKRVWLFRGIGSPGAVSDEAIELSAAEGIEVIPGACPMMFLEPVAGVHKFHRAMRRMNHSLAKVS